MDKYLITIILRDKTKIKIETDEMSRIDLESKIKEIFYNEENCFVKRGTIKIEFNYKDIKKLKYKVLED